jgi:P-type Mg2+ transporter
LRGEKTEDELFELDNIIFMGTSVISGSGVALVLRTGDGKFSLQTHKAISNVADAFIATIMKQLNKRRPLNSFQRGVRNVTYMMIAFMLVMVPIVSLVVYFIELH